jgi:hypothetical protein
LGLLFVTKADGQEVALLAPLAWSQVEATFLDLLADVLHFL